MKRATTATIGSKDTAPAPRARQRTPEVNRWVAMLDAELRAEDSPATDESSSVEVTFEFGRGTFDPAATRLKPGDSLRLDQLADEPLDVLAAGRCVARGELVVVDGQLGVRIVEVLMLIVAWFAIGIPTSVADERPRERTTSVLFDNNAPEILETPFSSARSKHSNSTEPDWPDEAQSNTVRRSAGTTRSDANDAPSTRLTPRSAKSENGDAVSSRSSWSATVWPLLLVVGLIVVGARWLKSRSPDATRGLPNEVFEVLGRKAVDPRTSVVLARSGSRLLLLSLSPHGLRTLAEITDPVETDCLAGLCRATPRDQSLVETFRTLLHKPKESKPATIKSPPNSLDERLAARLNATRTAPVSVPEARS